MEIDAPNKFENFIDAGVLNLGKVIVLESVE